MPGSENLEENRKKFFWIAFYLGKSTAPYSIYSGCKEQVLQFRITDPFVPERFLLLECTNSSCRFIDLKIRMPDHFF